MLIFKIAEWNVSVANLSLILLPSGKVTDIELLGFL